MKILKNKIIAIAIAMLLMDSMTASIILIPGTFAHNPAWSIPTIAFITVGTNPVGVGQEVNIGFWLNQPPPTASGPFGDRWQNLTVIVKQPDGKTQTLGPFASDDTGGTHTQFLPTQVGQYTFQLTFPGQTLAGANPQPGAAPNAFVGDIYAPSVSSIVTMTVQNEPVGGVPVAPLPTNYWQTPINAMNVNNWYVLGGAWLGLGSSTGHGGMYNTSCNYNPYTTAPKSSHILWTKTEAFGGVLGGQFGGTTTYGNYYATAQYEKKFTPVIINGFLYYNAYPGSSTTTTGLLCVDLFTGETVWDNNGDNWGGGSPSYSALTTTGLATTLLCGQVLDMVTPNQYGGLAYLWTTGTPAWITSSVMNVTGTTLNMFDAKTGTYILSIVNGTSPTWTVDDMGNLMGYYVNGTTGNQTLYSNRGGVIVGSRTPNGPTINEWNSTQCITYAAWNAMASGWSWRPPQNGLISFNYGVEWSMPVATNVSGTPLPATMAVYTINSGVITTVSYSPGGGMLERGPYTVYAGYDQNTGQQMWLENLTIAPFVPQSGASCTSDQMTCGNGVWTVANYQNSVLQGYSMTTGALLWTDNLAPFNAYDSIGGWMMNLANGTLYVIGFGGDIWSINILNGHLNWYTNTTTLQGSAGTNTPYGIWPVWVFSNGAIADGTLFLEEGHEYSPPLFLGAQQLAINCTTGKLIWSIDAFNVDGLAVIAYGVMPILNAYDNQLYGYGMGPSKTTVAAPSVGVTTSTPITISGTVTDISAGSKQEAVAANFPNGLPCVSDASMSQFMETVYMQQPMQSNTTGVPITISVLDSNNNFRTIGTTSSDASGNYAYAWTPDIPGNYTVYANFAGSNSYYGSSAETSFVATQAAATAAPTSAVQLVNSDATQMYVIVVGIAIVIAIAIGFAVTILTLRKRP